MPSACANFPREIDAHHWSQWLIARFVPPPHISIGAPLKEEGRSIAVARSDSPLQPIAMSGGSRWFGSAYWMTHSGPSLALIAVLPVDPEKLNGGATRGSEGGGGIRDGGTLELGE